MQQWLVHLASRLSLALTWIYQGLAPKLIERHAGELTMIQEGGFSEAASQIVLTGMGIFEVAIGLSCILFWRNRAIFPIMGGLLAGFALGAFWTQPSIFLEPFNPASLTIAMLALCAIGWLSMAGLPSAANCIRINPRST